jgi:ubiquinone/menaquinone biosynthesis C-methylase UbiE
LKGYRDIGTETAFPPDALGWDQEAVSYRRLPAENPIFVLGHQLMYRLMARLSCPADWPGQKLLDFNCGSGNDFPFFLRQGFQVVGCDGSGQMLQQARQAHSQAYAAGQLRLLQGRAEDLQAEHFPAGPFDWIYATTGAFSYVDDAEFLRQHRALYQLLKPGGRLLTAQLTPFCLSASIYYLLRGRFRAIGRRWPGRLQVHIGGQWQPMYLRSYAHLRRLMGKQARYFPVLAVTPPYQTGYRPSRRALDSWATREERLLSRSWSCHIADQVAVYLEKPLGHD